MMVLDASQSGLAAAAKTQLWMVGSGHRLKCIHKFVMIKDMGRPMCTSLR